MRVRIATAIVKVNYVLEALQTAVVHIWRGQSDVPQTGADVSKAQRLLGWAPHTTLESGLRTYRSWLSRKVES